MIGVINMMHVFTGKDTYVFEMTRGLITAKELMSIFKNTDDPLFIKGSDGKWCKVESVFESKSKNIVPVKLTTRDGIDLVVGSNSTFRCPAGDLYNPRVISKSIRELSEKDILVVDNMESFQYNKVLNDVLRKMAYLSRNFRKVYPSSYSSSIESYRTSISDIDRNKKKFEVLKDMFKCTITSDGHERTFVIGKTNDNFNIISEYANVYGIDMTSKGMPSFIWKCDIDTRKKFWKYFSEFDTFFTHIHESTGSPKTMFVLKDYQHAVKTKLFLTSIGLNVSILYIKTKDYYVLETRGADNVARIIDPFKTNTVDNTKTWSYNGWAVHKNSGIPDTISFCSKEKYEVHRHLYDNSFYKDYYKYNINSKIKSMEACDSEMLVIGVSDDNVYISLNGIFVRGGF